MTKLARFWAWALWVTDVGKRALWYWSSCLKPTMSFLWKSEGSLKMEYHDIITVHLRSIPQVILNMLWLSVPFPLLSIAWLMLLSVIWLFLQMWSSYLILKILRAWDFKVYWVLILVSSAFLKICVLGLNKMVSSTETVYLLHSALSSLIINDRLLWSGFMEPETS